MSLGFMKTLPMDTASQINKNLPTHRRCECKSLFGQNVSEGAAATHASHMCYECYPEASVSMAAKTSSAEKTLGSLIR